MSSIESDAEEAARPLASLERIGLVLGPVVMLAWIYGGIEVGLPEQAHKLLGVMLLTIIWWLTEPIPIPITGLVATALCVFLGAVPTTPGGDSVAKTVLAPYADPSVYFLFGGMFIGRAMSRHGLDRRIALSILTTRWASRSPSAVLAAVGLSVGLVSMWISNTAATAMVYPVTLGIIGVLGAGSSLGEEKFARSPFATGLLLMTAYASSVGGIATPIGTATNVVAMGYFRDKAYFGVSADFARWMMVGVPLMALLGIGLFLLLRWRSPARDLNLAALREFLQRQRAQLGPWNQGEINTLLVFLTVVSLWVAPAVIAGVSGIDASRNFTSQFPEEIVALLAPILLFLLPVDWRARKMTLEASDLGRIDWGTMLLFGAGLSLGKLMFQTGLAEAIGRGTIESLGTTSVWEITALAIAGAIILSEFTSNAATATTLIPVVWAICQKAEIDGVIPLMGVTFGASFGSALPVSTPPNAIVYGSGLIPARRMIVAGLSVDIMCCVAIWGALRIAGALNWTPFLK